MVVSAITAKIVAAHYYKVVDDHLEKTMEIIKNIMFNECKHR